MTESKKVVLIGLAPSAVDFDKWPQLTPEKLVAALEGDRGKLNDLGYSTELLLLADVDAAYNTVKDALAKTSYDCVLIGAGVRTDADHFLLFEKLINAAHEGAPSAKICFNTNPMDTADAVQRWL